MAKLNNLKDPFKRIWFKTAIALTVSYFCNDLKILPFANASSKYESKEERNNYNNLDIPNIRGQLNIKLSRLIKGKIEYFSGSYLTDGQLDIDAYNSICKLLRDASLPPDKYVQIDIRLITLLTGIQWWLEENGYPSEITVVSGYRSLFYNESVGGKRSSYHLSGRAVDIRVNVPLNIVAQIAKKFNVGGIGVYYDVKNKFIHLDTGPEVRRW